VAATATSWPHGLEPQLAPPDLTGLEARPADELLAWAIAPCTRPTRPGELDRLRADVSSRSGETTHA